MAVVQISRIQVRRGQKQTTGMPQLASGELAWAIDTQELYIGNGSVFEGSPAVGNTKILTQNDLTVEGNLLSLLQYIYKNSPSSNVQTGPTANDPVSRPIQDRLDERVSLLDFISQTDIDDGDYTTALQRAINQVFLNSGAEAWQDNLGGKANRTVLELPAGEFSITGTINIPSYATIVGAGSDKTIIHFNGSSTMFEFLYDDYESAPQPLFNTQARYITLKGMTLHTSTSDQVAVNMYCVRNSTFDDIAIEGEWSGDNENSIGLKLSAFSSAVTCNHNTFKNVTINGFNYGVFATQDIIHNSFQDGRIYDVKQGFCLGKDASGYDIGEQYGPRQTSITNYKFDQVKQHGVYIELGSGNTVNDSQFWNVGRDNGGVSLTQYPQIYFATVGNSSENNSTDRYSTDDNPSSTTDLTAHHLNVPYVPEISGWGTYTSFGSRVVELSSPASDDFAFRLPVATDSSGTPRGATGHVVDYVYQAAGSTKFTRRGKLTISVWGNATANNAYVQLSDEYDFAGTDSPINGNFGSTATQLEFSAQLLDQNGNPYTNSAGQDPCSIAINYSNALASDVGYLTYSYKSTYSKYP